MKLQEIYADNRSGVISGIKVRVYRTSFSTHARLLPDWSDILLTARFDGAEKPQVFGILFKSLEPSVTNM